MLNEIVIACFLFTMVLFIYISGRMGRDWLVATMVFAIVLSNIFAVQSIDLFGLTFPMNILFYTPTFIVTAMLTRQYGRKYADHAISISVAMVAALFIFSYLSLRAVPLIDTIKGANALSTIFTVPLHAFCAGLVGYAIAQFVYVRIYEKLAITSPYMLGAQVLGINFFVQALAAFIFYPVAFWGVAPLAELMPLIVTSWLMQVAIITLMSPIIFAPYKSHDKK